VGCSIPNFLESAVILKRRINGGGYTVLQNAVLNDERLSLEAMGLLAWLRSKPHDWTLQFEHLRNRFRIGRDKAYKLVTELIEAGWIVKEWRRDGKFIAGIEYVVLDEPRVPEEQLGLQFPEKPETQEAQPSEAPLEPRTAEVQTTVNATLQCPAFPDTDFQDTEKPETILSKDKVTNPPLPPVPGGSDDLDSGSGGSLPAIIKADSPEERELRDRTRKRLRCRERGEPTFETPRSTAFVHKDSDEWRAWLEHKGKPSMHSSVYPQGAGALMPSRWPPGAEARPSPPRHESGASA